MGQFAYREDPHWEGVSPLQPALPEGVGLQWWTEEGGVESTEEWRLLAEQHHAEGGMWSVPEDPMFVDGRNVIIIITIIMWRTTWGCCCRVH